MEGLYIYEFLFRGGEDSQPDDDTWHVVLARSVKGLDGVIRPELYGPYTPAQAEEFGYSLNRIVNELNMKAVATAAEVTTLRQQLSEYVERSEIFERAVRVAATETVKVKNELRAATAPRRSLFNRLSFGLLG